MGIVGCVRMLLFSDAADLVWSRLLFSDGHASDSAPRVDHYPPVVR